MIYGAGLALIAAAAMVNGVDTVLLPAWRQGAFAVLALLAYLYGRRVDFRYGAHLLLVAAALTVPVMFADRGEGVTMFMVLGAFVMLPWFGGRYRRQQVELLKAEQERTARLEREQDLVAERAQAVERARIAADLHDSVGHDLALIALRAGALELAPDLPERHREAAAALRTNAVEATDRLRQSLGMLREEAAPVAPVDEPVRELVARAAEAGLEVRLDGGDEVFGPLVDRAVYRVVQEALTNAAKHSPGAAVAVLIEREDGAVLVRVLDTGGAAVPRLEPGGSGLAALAERVRLLGGSFSAGRRGGGFAVEARMPLQGER
ncbi:histidine kinase [Glycomyces sp. NPDC047010]|uniref:sensor histidine kinase n=1 Tax=Glycomyces sp. NPDC047010 TaxID=3155023 RepID=UPI0033DAF42D